MSKETSNTEAAMQQIRENMNKQLAVVKAQLEQAREQSLQAVNEAVNHTMHKLVNLMPTADVPSDVENTSTSENKEGEPDNSHDAALHAMKIAEENIRKAIDAANESMKAAQDAVKNQ